MYNIEINLNMFKTKLNTLIIETNNLRKELIDLNYKIEYFDKNIKKNKELIQLLSKKIY